MRRQGYSEWCPFVFLHSSVLGVQVALARFADTSRTLIASSPARRVPRVLAPPRLRTRAVSEREEGKREREREREREGGGKERRKRQNGRGEARQGGTRENEGETRGEIAAASRRVASRRLRVGVASLGVERRARGVRRGCARRCVGPFPTAGTEELRQERGDSLPC